MRAKLTRTAQILILSMLAGSAHAALVTYQFIGATAGSYQNITSAVYTPSTNWVFNYDYGYSDWSPGDMFFTVDTAGYSDAYVAYDGISEDMFLSGAPTTPWLSSTATLGHVPTTVTTSGTVLGLYQATNGLLYGARPHFNIQDYSSFIDESSADAPYTSNPDGTFHRTVDRVYNSVGSDCSGCTFSYVDGVELVTGFDPSISNADMRQEIIRATYLYDADFNLISQDWYRNLSIVHIAAATVTITSAVPEPSVYGMMLSGFGLLGLVAARRKGK